MTKEEKILEVRKRIEEKYHPDPDIFCLKSRPVTKGMLGGPKYICKMFKGHEGTCFKLYWWSPNC